MSHIVSIKTEVHEPMAVAAACPRLQSPGPQARTARLYSAEAIGLLVKLPDWLYPVVCDTAFLDEFTRLAEHVAERITGSNDDGTPKIFRESAVGNLVEFFDRFRMLNVRSNDQLDALVDQAQQAVRGVRAQDLRDSDTLRLRVAGRLAGVQSALDGLLVDQPRRRILRDKVTTGVS